MKMSEAFLCCDRCFDSLAKKSTKAAKLWMDLCAIHAQEVGVFGLLNMEDSPHLRAIELERFVTTTETNIMVTVKVHGLYRDEKGFYYCPRSCSDE